MGSGGVRTGERMKLTKSELHILSFYRSLGAKFCRSIKTIARETGKGTKTVQRTNDRFKSLGILMWAPGNSANGGHANRYWLRMQGIPGHEVLGVTSAMLRNVQKQIRVFEERVGTPIQPNHPTHPLVPTYPTNPIYPVYPTTNEIVISQ
jgi:hypothetical protein